MFSTAGVDRRCSALSFLGTQQPGHSDADEWKDEERDDRKNQDELEVFLIWTTLPSEGCAGRFKELDVKPRACQVRLIEETGTSVAIIPPVRDKT